VKPGQHAPSFYFPVGGLWYLFAGPFTSMVGKHEDESMITQYIQNQGVELPRPPTLRGTAWLFRYPAASRGRDSFTYSMQVFEKCSARRRIFFDFFQAVRSGTELGGRGDKRIVRAKTNDATRRGAGFIAW
jgi:hypothetical protein